MHILFLLFETAQGGIQGTREKTASTQKKRLHLLKAVNHYFYRLNWFKKKKKKQALITSEKFLLLLTCSQHRKVEILGIKN